MAAYRYPLPRGYRRARYPYKFRKGTSGNALPLVIAGAVLAAGAGTTGVKAVTRHHAAPAASAPAPADGNAAAAKVIAFARAQLGKPYLWGGTGPGGFDCSGLAMKAFAAAGIPIERTSQQQWATLPHIPRSQVRPGDLVFFPGSDGTFSAPGHVAIVISATRMIQAYATGTPVEVSPLNGDGAGGIVGFARPEAPASPVTAAAPAPGDAGNVALGRRLAAAYGWSSGGQWSCLYDLWERESGWQAGIANPSSGAFGVAQALGHGTPGAAATGMTVRYPGGSSASGVTVNEYPSRAANSGDPRAQIRWGLADISSVYGDPCAAWSHEEADSWY